MTTHKKGIGRTLTFDKVNKVKLFRINKNQFRRGFLTLNREED